MTVSIQWFHEDPLSDDHARGVSVRSAVVLSLSPLARKKHMCWMMTKWEGA